MSLCCRELLAGGAVGATLAAFVARFMGWIAAVQLVGAASVATGLGPLGPVDGIVQTLSGLLFVRAWSRSASGEYMRLVGGPMTAARCRHFSRGAREAGASL